MNDAYAAGLVDGEGCIHIDKTLTPRLEIGMAETALDVLKAFRREYGGTIHLGRAETEKWAASYHYTITGGNLAPVLLRLLPHLFLKREQADLALAAWRLRDEMPLTRFKRPGWTPELRERGEAIRARVKELNRKGPDTSGSQEEAEPFALLVGGTWVRPQTSLFDDLGYETYSGAWPSSGTASRGACWTLDTSESPSGAVECSLSDILEESPDRRFALSARAARGILRRASVRGRALPPELEAALRSLA